MSEKPTDTCGPCRSGLHERCYEPCLCRDRGHPVETLTPSEVALAKVLAAWEAHRFCEDEGVSAARVIDRITDVLCECGMVDARGPGRRLDPEARALLDRARKAGVV